MVSTSSTLSAAGSSALSAIRSTEGVGVAWFSGITPNDSSQISGGLTGETDTSAKTATKTKESETHYQSTSRNKMEYANTV